MILPKSNLSIMDVRNAIGYPSTDLGTLCSAGENYINIWSKYKPVHNNFTTNRPVDWWKGKNKNCGINFVQYNTVAKLIESVNNNAALFTYDKPQGGVSSAYRLGDFCGYSTESLTPIAAGDAEGTYYISNNNLSVYCYLPALDYEYDLTIEDLFGDKLNNMYFSIALQRANYPAMWLSNSDNLVEQVGSYVTFPISNLTSGVDYYLYQFISSYSRPTLTSPEIASGTYFTIPGKQKQIISIRSTNIFIFFSNLTRSKNGVVSGTIDIENQGNTQTFTNVSVQVRYMSSNPNDPLKAGESTIKLANITVAANQTVSVPFSSAANALPNFNEIGGKCLLYMNNELKTEDEIIGES